MVYIPHIKISWETDDSPLGFGAPYFHTSPYKHDVQWTKNTLITFQPTNMDELYYIPMFIDYIPIS
jgi:hypothetical protein